MRNILTKVSIIVTVCITILVSFCPPSFAIPRRVEECGVESYISKRDSACGVESYISKESSACGVQSYKQQKSKDCPGYTPAVTTDWVQFCPTGYQQIDSRRRSWSNCALGTDTPVFVSYSPKSYLAGKNDGCANGSTYEVKCLKPESAIPTCRLPKFGVEKHKVCRHPSNGIEAFKTCSLPVFGVAQYKECDIRKTRAELTAYIQGLEPNIDVMGVALVQNTGNLLKLSGNETAMACYIKRWDSDPLYKDSLDELKTIQFPALFGVPYDPNNYDCSNPPPLSVSNESCSDGTPRCKFQTAYNAASNFFTTNKAEIAALVDDIVARNDSTLKNQLESLNAKMDSYYKP